MAKLGILLMASGMGKVKQSAATAALVPSRTLEPANWTWQVMVSDLSGRSVVSCEVAKGGKL